MAASRGEWGHLPPPVRGSAPHLPPQSEEKNGQNQPFSAIFLIFAPSEMYFAPSMPPPTKNFLVPPLRRTTSTVLFGYNRSTTYLIPQTIHASWGMLYTKEMCHHAPTTSLRLYWLHSYFKIINSLSHLLIILILWYLSKKWTKSGNFVIPLCMF